MTVQFLKPHELLIEEDFDEQFVSPLYSPASESVELIHNEMMRLKLDSAYSKYHPKMHTLFASLIITALRTYDDPVVAFPMKNEWWAQNSTIGYKLARKFKTTLEERGIITQIANAQKGFGGTKGRCAIFAVDWEWLERFKDIKTISSRYPHPVRVKDKDDNEPIDRRAADDIQTDVIALMNFWEAHPLVYKNARMTVARRVFNINYNRGGRFYGPWTHMRKVERMKMTIDEEPICQIDISAAFLTLLQAITKNTGYLVDEEFSDPYTPTRLHNVFGSSDITREKVKQFINAWIGGGNPKRHQAGNGLSLFPNDTEFKEFRNKIMPYFPELKLVNKQQLCGMGLQKHESTILNRVMLSLYSQGVVSYPMHDCIIVPEKEMECCVFALQKTMQYYLRDIGALQLMPALSVEMSDGTIKHFKGQRFS
jgi:hypothetical protein